MFGFKVEYKLESLGENKARVHKRIVTPVCFFRLGFKDYSYEVFKGVLIQCKDHFYDDFFLPICMVPTPVWVEGGSSSTHLCGRWKCGSSSGRVLDLLESHKKSFVKRLNAKSI